MTTERKCHWWRPAWSVVLTWSTTTRSTIAGHPLVGLDPRSRQASRAHIGERNLRQTDPGTRVIHEMTRQGFHLGNAPYGYVISSSTAVDSRGRIRSRSRLVLEPSHARVVRTIFTWRAAYGLTVEQILRHLNNDHLRYPTPPSRRPDHLAQWHARTIAGILSNPRYTGYQVRNFRDYTGALRPADHWVVSDRPAHSAIVTPRIFWAAQDPCRTSMRAMRDQLLVAERRLPWA